MRWLPGFSGFLLGKKLFPLLPSKSNTWAMSLFYYVSATSLQVFSAPKVLLTWAVTHKSWTKGPMQSTSPVGDVGWQHVGTTPLCSDETRSEGSVRWTFPGNLKKVTVARRRRGHFPGNGGLSSMHSMLLSQRNPI